MAQYLCLFEISDNVFRSSSDVMLLMRLSKACSYNLYNKTMVDYEPGNGHHEPSFFRVALSW